MSGQLAAAPRRGNVLTRSLRLQLMLATMLILGIAMSGIYVASRAILLDGFATTEHDLVVKDVGRVGDAISAQNAALDGKISDLAAWDDTYQFMDDHNQGYVDTNLPEGILQAWNASLFAFVGTDRTLVATVTWDQAKGVDVPLPDAWKAMVTTDGPLLAVQPGSSLHGLVRLSDGTVMLVASRPILTSSGDGPSRGTMIIGQLEQLTGNLADASASLSRTAEHLAELLAGYRLHAPPTASPAPVKPARSTTAPAPQRSPRAA